MFAWFTALTRDPVVAVEPAMPSDAAALARIHAAAFHRGWAEDEFRQMIVEPNTLVHRLRRGQTLVGFAASRIAADEAELLTIAIAAFARGGGLSQNFLETHLGHLAGRGVRTVFLEVEDGNAPAQRLYARLGFVTVGRRERYYRDAGGTDRHAVVMRRDLQ